MAYRRRLGSASLAAREARGGPPWPARPAGEAWPAGESRAAAEAREARLVGAPPASSGGCSLPAPARSPSSPWLPTASPRPTTRCAASSSPGARSTPPTASSASHAEAPRRPRPRRRAGLPARRWEVVAAGAPRRAARAQGRGDRERAEQEARRRRPRHGGRPGRRLRRVGDHVGECCRLRRGARGHLLELFRELVQPLRDKVSKPATKAALHALVGTVSWGRNRIKAMDAGAIPVLVDMLVDAPERRACELALDRLCGRAELVAHGAGVAVVGRKALRVSDVATDKAVRVLRSVAKHAATAAVVQEMAQAGAVGALCLVAQSSEQCGERTKERARETLRLHARPWRSSPCLHPHLRAMYPPC